MTALASDRWSWRRPRREDDAPAPPVMAGYTGETIWTRHRRLLFGALGLTAFLYGFFFGLFGTFILMQLVAPLAVIAGFSVWLLPSTGRAPVKMLDRLLMTFMAVLIIWPNYLALALPGMPWITFIRLVATPLALVMLVSLSTSEPFRDELKEIVSATPPIWKLLAAFTVIAFLSIFVSKRPGSSLNKFVVAQFYWTLIFFTAAYALSKPGRATVFVRILWIGLVVVSLIGFYEWRHKVVPWAGHVPSFLKVDDELAAKLLTSLVRKASGAYRVKSVFTTPLSFSEYLALCTPFLIHLAVTGRQVWIKAAAAVSIALAFYMITKTDSRLGVVGFFVSFLLYLLAWGALRWKNHRGSVAGPIIVLGYPALFCAFIAASFAVRRLRVMMWGGGATQASSDARAGQIAKGLPQIASHPWGYGMGEGGNTLHYANQAGVFSIDTYYLSVALEFGVIGFIVYYGMFVAGVLIGGRYALDAKDDETKLLVPLVISIVNFLVIKAVLSQDGNHPIAFAMLGAIVALVYRIQKELPVGADGRRTLPFFRLSRQQG